MKLSPGVYINEIHTESFYHNPHKVFTKHCKGPLEIENYKWVYNIEMKGILMLWTIWLSENCKSPWAWWFDTDKNCHVGFVDRDEMINFILVYSSADI